MSKVILKKILSLVVFAFFLVTLSLRSFGNGVYNSPSHFNSATNSNHIRNEPSPIKGQVARIMFAGLGGAVFGVSTLSFYEKPQNHLSNVAVGAIIGLLLGSAYVTSDSLEKPNDIYSYKSHLKIDEMTNSKWAFQSPLQINLKFDF